MYLSGMTLREVAKAAGMSPVTVLKRLKAAGVERRNAGNQSSEQLKDSEWLKAKYESGLSTTQIAEEIGSTSSNVSRYLKLHGIKARPTGSVKGWKMSEDGRKRVSEGKKGRSLGESNPNWRGGSVHDPERNRYQAKKWVKAVKDRDGWMCVECGAGDGKLHAHHIRRWKLYPALRYELSNGITLCETCHQAAHGFVSPWNRHAETSTSAQPLQ